METKRLLSWIAQGRGSLRGARNRGGQRPVFCAEKGNELSQFVLGERVAEAGHLLPAILDLGGNLRGLQGLADVGQGRTLLGSLSAGAVAVGAAFVTKEVGSGLFRRFLSECVRGREGKNEGAGGAQDWKKTKKAHFESDHFDHFLICAVPAPHP